MMARSIAASKLKLRARWFRPILIQIEPKLFVRPINGGESMTNVVSKDEMLLRQAWAKVFPDRPFQLFIAENQERLEMAKQMSPDEIKGALKYQCRAQITEIKLETIALMFLTLGSISGTIEE
jgi:hypothetical protein